MIALEPLGLLHGRTAKEAVAAGVALPLAGGPLAFTYLRHDGAPRPAADLAATHDTDLAAAMNRLTAPRASIAGLDWSRPAIMGIVNVTPDSFSDGGRQQGEAGARHGHRLLAEGADILDIGGESTRPGADTIAAQDEWDRVAPALEGLRGCGAPLSIDTRKPLVMARAEAAGVALLNDVSALTFTPESLATAAATGLPVVLMHNRGDPKTMNVDPRYDDVVGEVLAYLAARIAAAEGAGIPRERIVADPGIGFGKTMEHSLALLAALPLFHGLGVPLLLGASRKRLIGTLSGATDPADRLPGSLAIALHAVAAGVQIVRVHDVGATRQAIDVWQAATLGVA